MSYQCALEAAGCEVIEFKEYGSYQGEWLAVVKVNGELGVIDGCYGSCSGCDAFEAEFGFCDEDKPDYKERLAEFGKTYLPALSFDHYIGVYEKASEDDWNDEAKEMLSDLKEWKQKY